MGPKSPLTAGINQKRNADGLTTFTETRRRETSEIKVHSEGPTSSPGAQPREGEEQLPKKVSKKRRAETKEKRDPYVTTIKLTRTESNLKQLGRPSRNRGDGGEEGALSGEGYTAEKLKLRRRTWRGIRNAGFDFPRANLVGSWPRLAFFWTVGDVVIVLRIAEQNRGDRKTLTTKLFKELKEQSGYLALGPSSG